VLFGTDWPVIDPERAIREIDELGLKPESKVRLLRENALEVFRLPKLKKPGKPKKPGK
jgi:predicted TIM-barrel fold metal-dependent hydrolase